MNSTTHPLKVSIQLLRLAPALIVVALMALGPANARANTIVFNTLGPGDTYNQNTVYFVSGSASSFGLLEVAAQFTAGASGFLATVDLGLTYQSSAGPGPFSAYLYGDASGSPDNANQTLLGSGTPTAQAGTTNNSLVSIAVAGNVPVTMGSLYWLVLKADPNTFDTWNFSSPPVTGNVDASLDGSTWSSYGNSNILPAFRITAQSPVGVPDSGSTWTLLLLGLTATCGLKFLVRRPA